MTDQSRPCTGVGAEFARHGTVDHSGGEYVGLADPEKHTQTVDGCFSIVERGMRGVYQHRGGQHLGGYLAEFEFRYDTRKAFGSEDRERAEIAIRGTGGERLTCRRPHKAQDTRAEATPT